MRLYCLQSKVGPNSLIFFFITGRSAIRASPSNTKSISGLVRKKNCIPPTRGNSLMVGDSTIRARPAIFTFLYRKDWREKKHTFLETNWKMARLFAYIYLGYWINICINVSYHTIKKRMRRGRVYLTPLEVPRMETWMSPSPRYTMSKSTVTRFSSEIALCVLRQRGGGS